MKVIVQRNDRPLKNFYEIENGHLFHDSEDPERIFLKGIGGSYGGYLIELATGLVIKEDNIGSRSSKIKPTYAELRWGCREARIKRWVDLGNPTVTIIPAKS